MENKINFDHIEEQTGMTRDDFFELLLDTLPVEIFVKNTQGNYLYVNQILCQHDGLVKSDYLGRKDQDLLEEELYSIYTETDREAINSDKGISFTTDTANAKNIRTFKMPFKKADGTLIGIAGYSYDSTISVDKMKKIQTELNKFEGIFKNSPIGIAIYDTMLGSAIEINDTFSIITGRSLEELISLPWEAYSHPAEIAENQQYTKLMIDGKIDGFNMEKRYVKADGSEVWVHMTVARYKDEFNQEAHVVMIMDITPRKIAEAKAKYYLDHDAMTGLYNRRYGEDKLPELDKPEYWPLSIIVADANGLKVTNDAFGHNEGDRIIKKLANAFLDSIKPGDYVVRTGGDEFTVFLPNTSGAEALKMMGKINRRFEEDTEDGFLLSMAMGCATKASPEETLNQVYQSAEARMYYNKIQDSNAHKVKIIEYLQKKLEKENPTIKKHCLDVKKYAMALGEEVGLSEEVILELGLAAYYHDIGKVGLNVSIINKKENLDQRDWASVMKHPELGYQILKSVPEYGKVADYVLYHHERVDGVGYPNASNGKEIPTPAKILSLAEAYSDMTMDRPYREKLTKEEAIAEIRNGAGTQFDKGLVDIFIDKVISREEDQEK